MSDTNNSNTNKEGKQTFSYIPAAALKRFADDLGSGDSRSNKFLQLNRERVHNFIDKPNYVSEEANPRNFKSRDTNVAGINNYDFGDRPSNTFIHLQKQPEFQSSLGPRSRFGEGDGSFFDRWLNSNTATSRHLYDKDGFPIMRFSVSEVKGGFKRHLETAKDIHKEKKRDHFVKPYAERRLERLEREKGDQEKNLLEEFQPKPDFTIKVESDVPNKVSLNLPPTKAIEENVTAQLTAIERENYFGQEARAAFFEYYHHLSRQRFSINPEDGEEKIAKSKQSPAMENVSTSIKSIFAAKKTNNQPSEITSETPTSIMDRENSWLRINEGRQTEEEKRLVLEHLLSIRDNEGKKTAQRPLSARTKFLKGCVDRGILPHPSLIIRKDITTMLNLSSLGIGNEVALLLAEALDNIPLLVGLSIADNNLTDIGLVPIVNKLSYCKDLRLFDLSNNKVDSLTATALRTFLSSDFCNLVVLRMQNANVDDYEASLFMEAIAVRSTLKEVDLCHNLLGSHEFAVKRTRLTGGEAIGRMLQGPNCILQILKLAWNMIRFSSAKSLVQSLQINQTLTYLDLSYNHIGNEGGEILGDSLHSNQSLRVLKVAHNNLTARPTLIIFAGVKSCKTLRELDISENPIGEEGARGLLALNITHGDRVKINIKNCSVRISDPTCWFEPFNPKGEYHLSMENLYERAVCFELLDRVSRDKDLEIKKMSYQSHGNDSINSAELQLQIFVESAAVEVATFQNYDEINVDDLNLSSHKRGEPSFIGADSSVSKRSNLIVEALNNDVGYIRDLFRDASNRIFEQYDTDHSGWLDREELAYILEQLGLQGSHSLVDKLFSIYDTDHSGKVEEEEFISFLMDVKKSLEKDNFFHTTNRFFYNPSDSANSKVNFTYQPNPENDKYYLDYSGPKPLPYVPPKDGKIFISVNNYHQSSAVFVESLGAGSIIPTQAKQMEDYLSASKTLSDGFALFEFALDATKWSINEARTFYKMMIKELGSPTQVLIKLLPHMATALDARMLVADALNHDFQQVQHLRTLLGPLYRIYIGLINGFYCLQLADSNDRQALLQLTDINHELIKKRQSTGKGDTSQRGDWMCFRNCSFDNEALVVTEEWLANLPEKGRLEFDFVLLDNDHFQLKHKEISNLRLFRLMLSLGLIDETKRRRMFHKLQTNHEEGRASAKGLGNKRFEILPNAAKGIADYLEILYDGYTFKRVLRPNAVELTKEESSLIDEKRRRKNLSSVNLNRGDSPRDAPKSSRRVFGGKADNSEELLENQQKVGVAGSLPQGNTGFPLQPTELLSADVYGHHIKDLIQEYNNNSSSLAATIDPALIASRVLDALETILSGRYLTCAQVAILLEKFPFGNILANDYSTYRVELIISLFSRIVDLVNFEYILKELENFEIAILYFRIGLLNVWSPLKPEGYIYLNLSRLEERKVAKLLIVLNYLEKGETWVDPDYRESRHNDVTTVAVDTIETPLKDADIVNSNHSAWILPHTWYSEEGLPSTGLLSLQYFSGKGKQINGCEPNIPARLAFMSFVLAEPFEEDVKQSKVEITTNFADEVLQQHGIKLSIQNAILPEPERILKIDSRDEISQEG